MYTVHGKILEREFLVNLLVVYQLFCCIYTVYSETFEGKTFVVFAVLHPTANVL